MWSSSTSKGLQFAKKNGRNGVTAIAIDKDKSSQYALRWSVENLLSRGQTIVLIHVVRHSNLSSNSGGGNVYAINDETGVPSAHQQQLEKLTKDLFLTFHCFCTRKEVHCYDVVIEESDVAKAITEYVAQAAIEHLVLGSSRQGFIRLLKSVDIPSSTLKLAPDFCTVYVISKSKLSSVRNASRPAPFISPLDSKFNNTQDQVNAGEKSPRSRPKHSFSIRDGAMTPRKPNLIRADAESIRSPFVSVKGMKEKPRTEISDSDMSLSSIRSPFSNGSALNWKQHAELSETESDISFISSNRPSADISFISSNRPSTDLSFISSNRQSTDRMSISINDSSRLSNSSASSIGSEHPRSKSGENSFMQEYSSTSIESDDVEGEMRRLKQELQKTLQLYSAACKEALSAKEMAVELHRWRIDEERRLKEARLAEESTRGKSYTGISTESPEAAERIAELESKKRVNDERKFLSEIEEQHSSSSPSNFHYNFRYRRYTIEEIEEATECFAESNKIGEGGYGPVFKCRLDHTLVAVKVLRPDANQGKSQFNREVEVLTCMRHPHMVLLLGACPEYGCLVYEYMANGSLEDCLCRQGNTPTLSWQLRFRIAAEIATGLLFLHRTKPEPIVHRDLKPANILLDQNYVSKIGDVGLARLVPPSVADDVTQYRMTSAAGTFCYIDPEYQQTGMLGVKSDVYSFGIILLQLVTAKPAMGLTHHMERAIEKGMFKDILDASVHDWPMDEALNFAKLGLQCAELRRRDRPDLGKHVLPELNRMRELAEQNMTPFFFYSNTSTNASKQDS